MTIYTSVQTVKNPRASVRIDVVRPVPSPKRPIVKVGNIMEF
jgi:hypothetical protein